MSIINKDEFIKALQDELHRAEYFDKQYIDGLDLDLIKSIVYYLNADSAKRAKVRKGINCHFNSDPECGNCPYDDIDLRCLSNLKQDILTVIGE